MDTLTGRNAARSHPARPPRTSERGFSLVEALVSLAVAAIMMTALAQLAAGVQNAYLDQRVSFESRNSAQAAMDAMLRLIRMAGTDPLDTGLVPLTPDPDGNGALDSIRVRADWNPPNGVLTDPYEDVWFAVEGDVLTIREAGGAAQPFMEGITRVRFAYLGANGAVLATPITTPGDITAVTVTVDAANRGRPATVIQSTGGLRARQLE